MVGVPGDTDIRPGSPIGNAAIAYIQETGSPKANIPPRPFLRPTVKAEQKSIQVWLKRAGERAMEGDQVGVLKMLTALGLFTVSAVRKRIRDDIPPPLSPRTIAARIARRKSKSWRAKRTAQVAANVAAGKSPQSGLFIALIDTGEVLNSITFVIRKRGSSRNLVVGKKL